jgi:hypothetical protein
LTQLVVATAVLLSEITGTGTLTVPVNVLSPLSVCGPVVMTPEVRTPASDTLTVLVSASNRSGAV